MSDELNPKQKIFVQELVQHGNQRRAYTKAYNTQGRSANSIDSCATKLLSNAKVQAYKQKLEENAESDATLSRHEKRAELATIVRDKTGQVSVQDKIKAIVEDNKMEGHNAPEKVETVHQVDMSQVIALVAAQRDS